MFVDSGGYVVERSTSMPGIRLCCSVVILQFFGFGVGPPGNVSMCMLSPIKAILHYAGEAYR